MTREATEKKKARCTDADSFIKSSYFNTSFVKVINTIKCVNEMLKIWGAYTFEHCHKTKPLITIF